MTGPSPTVGERPIPGREVLRQLARISAPPWGRLALAALLGVAAALATVGLLAGSGYVVDRAAFRPGLGAIAGLLAAVEVLAFLRGPLRYGERLVGHDAAFRALTGWRVWLYDRLEPLSPAGLRAWRSGDLLSGPPTTSTRSRISTCVGCCRWSITVAAATLAVVVVAVILPVAGLVLAASSGWRPWSWRRRWPWPPGRRAAGRRRSAGTWRPRSSTCSRAPPTCWPSAGRTQLLDRVEAADRELTRLARRRALAAGATSAVVTLCVGAAVVGRAGGRASPRCAHSTSTPVMLAVLPLAAIGAFESVPAVAAAALRTGRRGGGGPAAAGPGRRAGAGHATRADPRRSPPGAPRWSLRGRPPPLPP